MDSEDRTLLEVGPCALCVGRVSVGFPMSRTSEQVIEAYLELIGLLRSDRAEDLRAADIDVLVAETGLERSFITNRVASQLSSNRV